jgi:tRNA A-37 threonylcarbamoyl transferase component Bud32
MSIIYGVDKKGDYSPNNYECFLASLEGSSIYKIDQGTTAIVLRVDFIEGNSLFREPSINEDGSISIKPVTSLAIKLGKAINQDEVFTPDTEYIEELDMDITIYGKNSFKKECMLQDEIFKKSFQYSFEHFRLPKSICPSVIFGGLFNSSKLGFLYPYMHKDEDKDESDFIKVFLEYGEHRYVNSVLLMPFIQDRMILYDFMKAFWEGIEMSDGTNKHITKEEYIRVLSNFLFNIFILHAIGYKHNDLQNTNLLTFGCNLDTITKCKYYIIDFGQSEKLTEKSSISDIAIIKSMQSGSPNESLLTDYKKYLSETYVSQYFRPELIDDLLIQTKLLFQRRIISEEIMENQVIQNILSK